MTDFSRGMHWIGHPAALVPVIDYGEESSEWQPQTVVRTSLGGTVRAAVSRKRPPRSWSLSIPEAHWDQTAALEELLASTLGPYQLVTARMQVSNVFTPERSVMTTVQSPSAGLAPGGVWPMEGGGVAASVRLNPAAAFSNEAQVLVGPAPTPPVWTGRPVTVSCWIATAAQPPGGHVVLFWLDAAGAYVGTAATGTSVRGMDVLRRSTVTATPPDGAVACQVGVRYAEVLSRPQVTWTPGPVEWSTGRGVDDVVVTGLSDGSSMAVPDSRDLRRADVRLEVQEVGP